MGNRTELRAQLVETIWPDAPPGSIRYFAEGDLDPAGLNFRCPCGCGGLGSVSFKPGAWTWDGDHERPTVRPSIYFNRGQPGEWHGFLSAGIWIPA